MAHFWLSWERSARSCYPLVFWQPSCGRMMPLSTKNRRQMFIFSECNNKHGYRQKEDSGGVTCSWEMLTYVKLLCRFPLPAPASSRGRRALSSILAHGNSVKYTQGGHGVCSIVFWLHRSLHLKTLSDSTITGIKMNPLRKRFFGLYGEVHFVVSWS